MKRNMDTIAAQATAAGEGGVAIVRLSGERSGEILSRVFSAKNGKVLENRKLTFGRIMDGSEVVDEAMAAMMRAPLSYTREDVAEIHCHGSQALVGRILRLLLREGARMAEPGEFTMRAFLNGRIDLAQAEAVMRMIRAGSERAMRSAVRQMEGGVSAFVKTAKEDIVVLLSAIAAAIDFPDEVEETETAQEVWQKAEAIRTRLLASCDARAGRIEDEGLRVVLAGRPNAGKSSLMNSLLGGERAIVTDVPGTTRDTLTESFQHDGVRINLTDTAGLRETEDVVERIGVMRARKAIDEADVRVLVIDGSLPLNEQEDALSIAPDLIVITKGDLELCTSSDMISAKYPTIAQVTVCAPKGEGMDELKQRLVSFAPKDATESSMLSQARHVEAAMRACNSLKEAQRAIDDGMPLDVCAVDLSAALDALGEITGETMSERVIDEVFARFCVGK